MYAHRLSLKYRLLLVKAFGLRIKRKIANIGESVSKNRLLVVNGISELQWHNF